MHKYEIVNLIGEGSYGSVYRCRHKESGRVVAVKEFKDTAEDELVRKTTNRQLKMLKQLRHENIVQFKQAYKNKNGMFCFVFEFVENNLLEILEIAQNGLPPDIVCSVVYQILRGLAYMHDNDAVHRDIKPQNILVGGKTEKMVKICDFGFARSTRREAGFPFTEYVATRWYRPPQLLVGATYGTPIDIWALGCIMGEITDGQPLFPGENELDQLFLIQKCLGKLPPELNESFLKHPPFLGQKFPEITHVQTLEKRYVGKLSAKALSLLKGMLQMSPDKRATAGQCLAHPYFDRVRGREQSRVVGEGLKQHRIESATYGQEQGQPYKFSQRTRQALKSRQDDRRVTGQYSRSINKSKANFRRNKEKHISLQKQRVREAEQTHLEYYPSRDRDRQSSQERQRQLGRIYNPGKKKSGYNRSRAEQQLCRDKVLQSTGQLPLIQSKEGRAHISIVINNNTYHAKHYNYP